LAYAEILYNICNQFYCSTYNRQQIQKKRLERMAITDELTGAYNQRFFHMVLESELEKAKNNNVL